MTKTCTLEEAIQKETNKYLSKAIPLLILLCGSPFLTLPTTISFPKHLPLICLISTTIYCIFFFSGIYMNQIWESTLKTRTEILRSKPRILIGNKKTGEILEHIRIS